MGMYINPANMSKEAYVEAGKTDGKITEISADQFKQLNYHVLHNQNKVALIHIDNGVFTALGVSHCADELAFHQRMLDRDQRPLRFFTADLEYAMKYAC